MKIKHSGNFQSILSPRCAMDAMKYSRNQHRENFSEKEDAIFYKIPEDAKIFLNKEIKKVELGEDSVLLLSNNPHTWLIVDYSLAKIIGDLDKGKINSQEIYKEALSLMYNKGLLDVNGSHLNLEELSGRYSVRSDNVALISVTDRCDLNCNHCVAKANENYLIGEELTVNELKNIFKELSKEQNQYGIEVEKKVFISGGEPNSRNDLEEIALSCSQEGLSTHICTNGLRTNKNMLKKIRGKGIAFSVSLDGEKYNHEIIRGKGTFDRTVENIKQMRKEGFDVFLNNFLHEGNIKDMEYLLNFGSENDIRGINFIRAIPRGRGMNMEFKRVPDKILFRKVYEFMKKDEKFYNMLENENTFPILAVSAISGVKSLNCGLSRGNYFFLDSVGNMYPCPGTRYPEFLVGNIRNSSFSDIYDKRNKHPISELNVENFPTCSQCKMIYFCGGDCRGSAYGNSNPKDIKSPVHYCNERTESLKEMFNILGEDPTFLKSKSNWIIKNAREETYKKD